MATKRIKDLVLTATLQDLVASKSCVIDTPEGTKKLPGNILNSTKIFNSLQDAISNASILTVGATFVTNGFYSIGDGGGARYAVTNEASANGMDVISLGNSKYAVLQIDNDEVRFEQLGYICDSEHYINHYWSRIIELGIHTIRLDSKHYYLIGNFIITLPGMRVIGNGNTLSKIHQVAIGSFGISVERANVVFSDFELLCDGETATENGIGISSRLWNTPVSHYNITFENLIVSNFRTGIELAGAVKWQMHINNVRVSLCYIGISLVESGFCYEFNTLLTDRCEYCGLRIFGQANVIFNNCNFGSISSAIRVDPWEYQDAPNPYHESTLQFNSCQFELDRDLSNLTGVYIYVSDDINITLNLQSCRFTYPIHMENEGNSGLSLGNRTCIIMNACELYTHGDHVNLEHLYDNSRFPLKKIGSVIIDGNCRCTIDDHMTQWRFPVPRFNDVYLPTVLDRTYSGIAKFNDNTNFEKNYNTSDNGTIVFNTSDECLYTFVNGKLCKITHEEGGNSGRIFIYNKFYSYVEVNGLLWLTEDLEIPTTNCDIETHDTTRQVSYLYSIDDEEMLGHIPIDWRIPSRKEVRDSLGFTESPADFTNCPKSCSTEYSSIANWNTATNIYGTNFKPTVANTNKNYNYQAFWTSSLGGADNETPVWCSIRPNQANMFGGKNYKIPVRLVRNSKL